MTQRNFSGNTTARLFRIMTMLIAMVSAGSSIAWAAMAGVTAGSGSLLDSRTGKDFLPRGFNSIGVLYPAQYAGTLCTNPDSSLKSSKVENMVGAAAAAEVTMTSETNRQLLGMEQHWNINLVRFPLSQGALQYEYASGGKHRAYTDMVRNVIAATRKKGLIVILAMQTSGFSCTPLRSNGKRQALPDQLTEEAWKQLLNSTLTRDRGVMLELFSEPNSKIECGAQNWTNWASGCGTLPDEGMVSVGKYVRNLAADNVLLFDGDSNAGVLTGFTVPAGMPSNSAYAQHPWDYVFDNSVSESESQWESRFGKFQAAGHTVVSINWSESAPCPSGSNVPSITDDFIRAYLPAHHIGLVVSSWDDPGMTMMVNTSTFAPINSTPRCDVTAASLVQALFSSEAGK